MSNTLARTPFARSDTATFADVDQNLKRVEQAQKGVFVPLVLVSARSPYSIKGTEWLILCDCTAGAITLTFPPAARVDGLHVTVVKTDASANVVTLSGTFSGVSNPTLTAQHALRTIDAGNGVYEMSPKAADLAPGTAVGDFGITGNLTVSGVVAKARGSQACANATATTLVTVTPGANAMYEVSAQIESVATGNAVRCGCVTSGSGVDAPSLLGTATGGLLALSVDASGNIQATQTAGGTRNVLWSILRVE